MLVRIGSCFSDFSTKRYASSERKQSSGITRHVKMEHCNGYSFALHTASMLAVQVQRKSKADFLSTISSKFSRKTSPSRTRPQ